MESRISAGFLWHGPLLGVAALLLGACATEMAAEVKPAPAAPQVVAAPSSPPPAAPEPPRVAPPPPSSAPPPTARPVKPSATAVPPPAGPPPPLSRGPVEVTGVEAQDAGPAGLVVVAVADGPIRTYESFTLPDPPRVILDIPNATHAIPQPISARPPIVTAIRSSQYREQPVKVVRLVLDLRAAVPYKVATVDNQVRVQLGAAVAGTPGLAEPPKANPGPTGRVTRVDLQSVRGRQRIVIGTRGRVTYNVTETADPPGLLVDIAGAEIAPADARTLDLRQVASPLNRLQATQFQDAPDPVVRVTADLRAPTRYAVQQTPAAIIVELLSSAPPPAARRAPVPRPAPTPTPPAVAAAPPPGGPAPPGVAAAPPPPPPTPGRISMDFKDADINNLLRIIAEVSGMNVVAGDDVKGKVTVRLVNVEWQQALDVILKINNLGYELDGNVIRVAPLAKLEAERKARDDARLAAARARETEQRVQVQVEPLLDRVLSVNYAKASDVVKNLDRLKTPGRPDANIAVDERTNTLIIRETAASFAKMETLLKRLDVPTSQVLIEARIVEATRTFSQSLGVEYGFSTKAFKQSGAGGAAGNAYTPVSVFTSQVGTTLTVPTTTIPLGISFPASGTSPAAVGIIAGNFLNSTLAVRLSAAESEGRIRTLSAPKVATLDNQEAEMRQGTQVPYTTVDSSGRTVIAFQDAFIRLKVTPHITNDRRVSMKVEAERSFPGERIEAGGSFAFVLNQRKATTNVLVSNGSTIVIGGLMQTTDTVSETGLPWLKNVPVLGALFKSHSIGPNDKLELLIFLTPTILEEPRLS